MPNKRRIIALSSSTLARNNLPDNVSLLPFNITIDEQVYQEGVNITGLELINILKTEPKKAVKISPPSDKQIQLLWQELIADGCETCIILCPMESYHNVYNIINSMVEFYEDIIKIHLLDTKTMSFMEALKVLEASKLMQENMATQEIICKIEQLDVKDSNWFTLNNTQCFLNIHNVSAPTNYFDGMKNYKPVFSFDKCGFAAPLDLQQDIYKAIDRLCHYAYDKFRTKPGRLYIISNGNEAYVQQALNYFSDRGIKDVPVVTNTCISIATFGLDVITVFISHHE